LDDVKLGEKASIFMFPPKLYQDLIEIPPEINIFIIEQSLEPMMIVLGKLVYMTKVEADSDFGKIFKLKSGLSHVEIPKIRDAPRMVAGTRKLKRKKSVRRKTKYSE